MNFDLHARAYDHDLRRGLRLAGEEPDWFARQRVAIVSEHLLAAGATVETILEFGCGVGNHIPFLRRSFPHSRIVGVDVSDDSLEVAADRYACSNVRFCTPGEFQDEKTVDLVYVNGVFHHIPAAQHADRLRYFRRILKPQGTLAIFDNNPFSLPARWVMKRIPFDKDAVMVNPYRFSKLMAACGFYPARRRFFFIFPHLLRFLRPAERLLALLPLGAQYVLLSGPS